MNIFTNGFINSKLLILNLLHFNGCNNKRFKGSTLKLFLSLSFIAIFLFPTFRINEISINDKAFPYFSSSELVISSPENKTYIEPMVGYYPSTYGFENYKDGTIGLDIGFLDEYYSSASGLNTDIRIIEELLDGHYNYLYIRDSQVEDNTWAVHYIDNSQSIGTIEFYNRFNNNPNGSPTRRQYLYFRDSNNIIAFRMEINHHNGDLKYYNGSSYELIANVNAETWYHHRIIFNCNDGTKGKFTWIIREEDGTEISRVSSIDFENNFIGSTIDEIHFETSEEDYELETMWDAFGFSWDPDYIIGDNLKEGLLLNFTNTTSLNWIGYSLNEQTNRTVLGNTTIALQGNGKYSIQLFGTDSIGSIYKSDITYFSFNTSYSEIEKTDIPIIPIFIILSVVGVSVPSSYMIINYEKKKRNQKKIKHQKGFKIKPALKKSYPKEINKIGQVKSIKVKFIDKKLSPIPQKIPIEEDNNDFMLDDLEEYNLKSLKELCNEWINQCSMHKESFEGLGYSCFNCHTKYCVKCAFTLAEKDIGCIVCGKLIPIIFHKKKVGQIKKEKGETTQNLRSILKRIFESENLLEEINQFNEINLTFFEKDFFKKIDRLELGENEKQVFIKDMLSLTPKERSTLINKIINELDTSNISNNEDYEMKTSLKSEKLQKIFKSDNLLEEMNQFEKIKLTFFERNFFKKINNLELDENEKQVFIKEMLSFNQKERNKFIKKLKRQLE